MTQILKMSQNTFLQIKFYLARQAKVSYFGPVVFAEKYVPCRQVSVNHFLGLQIDHSWRKSSINQYILWQFTTYNDIA